MRLQSCTATHVGRVRTNNEDAFLADDARGLYAVADGMGGYAAGEVASKIAIESLRTGLTRTAFDLERTTFTAHRKILDAVRGHRDLEGMGTTLTACQFAVASFTVTQVGDSACYLVRRGRAVKLTVDQSSGRSLDNCLGHAPSSFKGPRVTETRLLPGDVVVLATDGLTRYVDEDKSDVGGDALALGFLASSTPFENLADLLVEYALDRGGHDNVTAVCVRVG